MAGVGGVPQQAQQRAVKMALGVVLLWLGGALLFVAFMSGKVGSLTVGKTSTGTPQGPRDASELVQRLAASVQAAEGNGTGGGAEGQVT